MGLKRIDRIQQLINAGFAPYMGLKSLSHGDNGMNG